MIVNGYNRLPMNKAKIVAERLKAHIDRLNEQERQNGYRRSYGFHDMEIEEYRYAFDRVYRTITVNDIYNKTERFRKVLRVVEKEFNKL